MTVLQAIDAHRHSEAEIRATLLARVAALKPVLRARLPACEAGRKVPDATIADLHELGFWRMLQPKRWGGYEVHPNTFFDVLIEIASACPSTAWVFGVVAVHNWQLALFDEQAQQDVWGDDSSVLVSSSYAPTGTVERVDGGYLVSGRWSFSSGVEHCDWTFLGGFVPTEPGQPPDMRTFLVPREDLVIEDTWRTFALKGTGSHDVVLDKAFVPEHRTHKMNDGFKCDSPGNALNPAPLFRIPFGQIFVRSVSTGAIGMAKGALEFYKEVTAVKVGASDGSPAVQSPDAQLAVAKAASALDQLVLVLHRNFDELMAAAEQGERVSVERRVAMRWDSSEAVSRAVEVVDSLFSLCGGRALFLDSPMHRFFCDVHGARAHYANRPETSGRNFGRVQLGLRTSDYFL
ncbi:MAG: acyl-CoA dehydrogenase family protein [Alphaproteobacteria bacterium]|nr:acyl-CoA dehydrogenase family protein [Alphaproteobacteria bacterium]